MKKILALVLALTMLLGCTSAMAAAVVPATMADVNAPAAPIVTSYTLTTKDDHYELTIDGDSGECDIQLEGSTENYDDWNIVWFYWDEEKNAYISDGLLDDSFSQDRNLRIDWYTENADGSSSNYSSVIIDSVSGEPTYSHLSDSSNAQGNYYAWIWNNNVFNFWNDSVDVYYNINTGAVRVYSVTEANGVHISYNKFGVITDAQFSNEGTDLYWDSNAKVWKDCATGEVVDVDLPDVTAEAYPAPYAAEFVVGTPATSLENCDPEKGEIYERSDGNFSYFTDTFNAYYDADGNLTEYTYWDKEETTYVTYDIDGNLTFVDAYVGDINYYWKDGVWYVYDHETSESTALDGQPEGVDFEDMKPLLRKGEAVEPVKPERTWYPSNTLGVAGVSLRDMGIGDKWINVVPVDLTQDGSYSFPLVASNLYYIGTVNVTVKDGAATTTYELRDGHGYIESECLAWFTAMDQITEDFVKNPVANAEFGEAVDLGGAETAVLYICNTATYAQPYTRDYGELTRFWPNSSYFADYKAAVTAMMENVPETTPVEEPATPTDATATATDVAATATDVTATATDAAATATDVATTTDAQ